MKFLDRLKNLFAKSARPAYIQELEEDENPRASFEIVGIENDQLKVEFNWNRPFIDKIQSLGFHAETEEDSVQLFFYASQMRPESLASDRMSPSGHPNLAADTNRLAI